MTHGCDGITGLVNNGNTCYINSLLQILSHTYELKNIKFNNNLNSLNNLKNDVYISQILFSEWNNLRNTMWSKNCVINPERFLYSMKVIATKKNNTLFVDNSQEDITELIYFIIECFSTSCIRNVNIKINGDIKNKKDKIAMKCYEMINNKYSKCYSELIDVFYGIQVSILNNKIETYNPESFLMINLDIPIINTQSHYTLYNCFDKYIEKEIVDCKDDKGNDIKSSKQYMFWSFPKILIIMIKRFNNNNNKNQTYIDFPLHDLDLNKYCIGYCKSNIYSLYGVCNHFGSTRGGHYTINNEWFQFNDTITTHIKSDELHKIVTPKAYCLFYRKK
jgi:ubiquitin C-terminal hydrolase